MKPGADEYELLSLARNLGLRSIQPALFYQCINTTDCPLQRLLQGEKPGEGPLFRLNIEDAHRCILGYRNVVALQEKTTLSWVTNDTFYGGCSAWPNCSFCRRAFPLPRRVGGMPLIHLLKKWDDHWEGYMCRNCTLAAQAVHDAGRREGWRRLPSLFGLPPWEELLANGGSKLQLLLTTCMSTAYAFERRMIIEDVDIRVNHALTWHQPRQE